MKRSRQLKSSHGGTIFSFVLFAGIIIWFLAALSNASEASDRSNINALRQSVENGISLCYSIEGSYPESIDYLSECYGVVYDKNKYIVHYECFADNIRPNVTVIAKED